MLGDREQTRSLVSLNKVGKRIKGVQKNCRGEKKLKREQETWTEECEIERELQKGEKNRETPEEEEGKRERETNPVAGAGGGSILRVGGWRRGILGTQELGKKNWNREKSNTDRVKEILRKERGEEDRVRGV